MWEKNGKIIQSFLRKIIFFLAWTPRKMKRSKFSSRIVVANHFFLIKRSSFSFLKSKQKVRPLYRKQIVYSQRIVQLPSFSSASNDLFCFEFLTTPTRCLRLDYVGFDISTSLLSLWSGHEKLPLKGVRATVIKCRT